MLFDDFFKLKTLSATETGFDALIFLEANHDIFQGHFPENPVTPGVVQMEIVKELLERETGILLTLKSMSNAKFLAVLDPRETPEVIVSLNYEQVEAGYKVSATIRNEEISFFKLQGLYASRD